MKNRRSLHSLLKKEETFNKSYHKNIIGFVYFYPPEFPLSETELTKKVFSINPILSKRPK